MVKRYRVTINDEVYQVSVESIQGGQEEPRPLAPVPGTRPAWPETKMERPIAVTERSAASASKPANPVGTGKKEITAPLPGNMWKVKTSEGKTVKRGEVLFVIEAMKMENEIFAPCDGTVLSVAVAEGAAVNTGDVLCIIS